jgi:hypothetical protein
MMNMDNYEIRKKVMYEVQSNYNNCVEERIMRINCDHDMSLRVMVGRRIFII